MPATPLIRVHLPAPLSPTRAVTSPARASKSTPLSTSTAPKLFWMPRRLSSGAAALGVSLIRPSLARGGRSDPTPDRVQVGRRPGWTWQGSVPDRVHAGPVAGEMDQET